MTDLKKIFNKVLALLLDIVLLTISTIKQLVLPSYKRKGNILHSVFVFFIGTIEILNRFEHGIFQMAKIFKHRYIRQGVIIISTFLFLLSSFEWTRGQEINTSNSNVNAVQLQPKVFKSISFNKATKAKDCLKKSCIALRPLARICPLPNVSIYSTSVKRYLLIRSILI